MNRESVSEASSHLGELVERARRTRQPTILTADQDSDVALAVVVPAAQYEEYLRLRDAEDQRRVREAVADDRPAAPSPPLPSSAPPWACRRPPARPESYRIPLLVYVKYDSYMQRMKISEARANLAEVIGWARYGREPTVLTDRGRDAVVVISPEQYAEFQRLRDEEDLRIIRERLGARERGETTSSAVGVEELLDLAGMTEAEARAAGAA